MSVLHASSLSQVITHKLLETWGHEGFFSHIDAVESFYKARRDAMLAAADAHLAGLCEYSAPRGGMFLWLRVPGLASTSTHWDLWGNSSSGENVPGYNSMDPLIITLKSTSVLPGRRSGQV